MTRSPCDGVLISFFIAYNVQYLGTSGTFFLVFLLFPTNLQRFSTFLKKYVITTINIIEALKCIFCHNFRISPKNKKNLFKYRYFFLTLMLQIWLK
jgi:hypothetical protein